MQQEKNRFVLKALTLRGFNDAVESDSSWGTVISSSTVADALAKLAEMVKEPSKHHEYSREILGFSLHDNKKHLMNFDANHSGFKVEINWRRVEFFNVSRDLLDGLKQAFPEQASLLKSLALDESLGL